MANRKLFQLGRTSVARRLCPEDIAALIDGEDEMEEGDSMFVDKEPLPSLKVPIPHYHIDEYKLKEMDQEALFKTVVKEGECGGILVENPDDENKGSALVTGFGMRNLHSLQDLLAAEEKRLYELYIRRQEQAAFQAKTTPSSSTTSSDKTKEKSSETTTDMASAGDARLQYLLGLEQEIEEIPTPKEEVPLEKDDFVFSSSACMRRAQMYLRVHRIFDFFQFIIAHLLSKAPENPIEFILELLNKCLLYRSGAGKPPTLYETKHFEQLFYLMDRMNTGYIDMEQYKQGMKTFGICVYNQTPKAEKDGVTIKTFVEEVEDAQLALFDDLIQKKVMGRTPKPYEFQPIKYDVAQVREKKSTFFMPNDLFKSYKREESKEEVAPPAVEG
ncbi:unnamed protein product [Phyllotreta striolata]|uniref:EFCAB10 C-terminal EF-hand domain-containing protein n=1 Tax=Phyllotreta striolata TaxID=444603 RepID=A0A9N9XRM0_PHYSR|nr:unnamed protein product [Phyllotreta striolata]